MRLGGQHAEEFIPGELEALVLSFTKLWLMVQDRRETNRQTPRHVQSLMFRDYATAVGAGAARLPDDVFETISGSNGEVLAQAVRLNSADHYFELLEGTRLVEALWDTIEEHDRALLVCLELVAFSPWGDGTLWKADQNARQERLRFVGANLGSGVESETLVELDDRLRSLTKRVRKLPVSVKKLVAFGAGGLAAGALSGGLAAPAIGGSIGASMGLSGAAATNAGLAVLGGGSLASGGLGMAGGAALIAGTAGVAGAGAAAAGGNALTATTFKVRRAGVSNEQAKASGGLVVPGTADETAVDGAKLCLLVSEVVLGAQRDARKARDMRDDLSELAAATQETVDRLGGGDASNKKSDQLTQIASVLRRVSKELDESLETRQD